jgi:hypothetical protein
MLVVTIDGRGVGLGVALAVGDATWLVVGLGVWSSGTLVGVGGAVGAGVGSGGGVGAGVGSGGGVGSGVGDGSVDASADVSGDGDDSSAETDHGMAPTMTRPSAAASNSRRTRE